MKYVLVSLGLLVSMVGQGWGQPVFYGPPTLTGGTMTANPRMTHHERHWQGDGRFFVVQYEVYREGWITLSVTPPPGQAHYTADIRVLEVVNGEAQLVAAFEGQYTDEECFEDAPEALVTQALEYKAAQDAQR